MCHGLVKEIDSSRVMSANGGSIVSFGMAESEKELIFKGEKGIVHSVVSELLSIGETQVESGISDSFTVTFHALQVY